MSEQKIHIIGDEEVVLMFGLLGIEGTIISDNDIFRKQFNDLTNNPKIDMIIIALDLPEKIIDDIVDFKLNKRKPFVFYLSDIFKLDSEQNDILMKKIYESIGKILK
ncbi:MAG: V-type ATP synthase subunit F [Candidatus Hermodarchaeota archaeon]